MSKLLDRQCQFAAMVPRLIDHARALGFRVKLGEAYRSPEEAARLAALRKGIRKSLHTDALAIDLHLFIGETYCARTEDHRDLGEWWESQGGSWGGRFGDGNHYSLEWEGRK